MTRRLAVNWPALVLCAVISGMGGEVIAKEAETVAARSPAPCSLASPCDVAPMHYIAVPPKSWDGHSPLRVAVWFHGYGRTAQIPARNKKLMQVFDKHNLLFVAPSGSNKGWSVPGTPQEGRDDIVYISDVLEDVAKRFPISRDAPIALGFSLGGSFVWTLACQRPEMFGHHVAFAGGFWMPHPKRCVEGPVDLLHIHGENDGVVPLHGRPIGSRWYQGDVPRGLKFWRTSKGCSNPSRPFKAATELSCRTANACNGAKHAAIISCRHPGGHAVKPEWVDWALKKLTEKHD